MLVITKVTTYDLRMDNSSAPLRRMGGGKREKMDQRGYLWFLVRRSGIIKLKKFTREKR
jgi:hypothetical protein